jgi:hypothetical protein
MIRSTGSTYFTNSGISYFESDFLDLSWATKVQMALALQTMPADVPVGNFIRTMVLQPGVEINVALLACLHEKHPEKKKKKKRKKEKKS